MRRRRGMTPEWEFQRPRAEPSMSQRKTETEGNEKRRKEEVTRSCPLAWSQARPHISMASVNKRPSICGVMPAYYFSSTLPNNLFRSTVSTRNEYKSCTGNEAKEWTSDIRSLGDMITLYPVLNGSSELQVRRAFTSLLKGLLQTDPKRRLPPERGLSHPFHTMVHLTDNMESPYLMDSLDKMRVFDLYDDGDENFYSDSVAKEDPRVEEAPAVPHSDDTGSAALLSCDSVEDLDPPCDGTTAANIDDTGSAAPHSSYGVEDLDHPSDGTAAANVDDTGPAAEESAESHHVPDSAQETQLCEETRPAKVSSLKKMRMFMGRHKGT
ncbi:unnamed protein product [Pleuronectes platessa]|uniref:Uncharacterized protein n=1 Tax=Pleuronectes platessa TaxID=8262 RepID=A0A9N7UYR8_PLEPL|nr:unnamed protein product [Pleuronectes platessa]